MHKPVLLCCQKQSNYMMQSFSFGHGNGPSVLNVDPETHILIRNLRESTAHNTDHPQKKEQTHNTINHIHEKHVHNNGNKQNKHKHDNEP